MKVFWFWYCFQLSIASFAQFEWYKKLPFTHPGMGVIDKKDNFLILRRSQQPSVHRLHPNGDYRDSLTFPEGAVPFDIEISPANEFLVAGSFTGTIEFGSATLTSEGASDMFIAAYDQNFSCIWAKSYGGKLNDIIYQISVSNGGKLYVCGRISDSLVFGTQQIKLRRSARSFFASLSSNGSPDWIICDSTNTDKSFSNLYFIDISKDDQLLVVGTLHSNWDYTYHLSDVVFKARYDWGYQRGYHFGIKFDSEGRSVWSQLVNGEKWGGTSFFDVNKNKSFRVEYNGGPYGGSTSYTQLDSEGIPRITLGGFSGSFVIGQIPEVYVLSSQIHYDEFGGHYPAHIHRFIGSSAQKVLSFEGAIAGARVLMNSRGEKFLLAAHGGSIVLNGDTINEQPYFGLLAKFDPPRLSGNSEGVIEEPKLALFPNPAKREIKVKCNEAFSTYRICDLFGRVVCQGDVTLEETILFDLPEGVYFVTLTDEKREVTSKMVVAMD